MGKHDIRWKWLEERGFNVLADRHQYAYMQALWQPTDVVQASWVDSPAGTGKTTLAVLAGAYEVEKGTYDKIIYIRSAIPIRDQGFLPGDPTEKNAPYMAPLADALEYVKPGTFDRWVLPDAMTKQVRVLPLTTAFARGVTWKNSFVIYDEVQNADMAELQAVLTRVDDSCKFVGVGSVLQIDNPKLKRIAGLTPFEIYMKHYEGKPVTYHKLETNYRGWFSQHADQINETIEALQREQRTER